MWPTDVEVGLFLASGRPFGLVVPAFKKIALFSCWLLRERIRSGVIHRLFACRCIRVLSVAQVFCCGDVRGQWPCES